MRNTATRQPGRRNWFAMRSRTAFAFMCASPCCLSHEPKLILQTASGWFRFRNQDHEVEVRELVQAGKPKPLELESNPSDPHRAARFDVCPGPCCNGGLEI